MSTYKTKKIKFDLNPGITMHVGQSKVVLRCNFRKGLFKNYIKAKLNSLPDKCQGYDIIDGTHHGVPMPDGLLGVIAAELAKHAAAGATLEDDDQPSENNKIKRHN
jgi:hypothetical protein